jgi:hypothetical protein
LEWLGDNQPNIFAYTCSVFNEFDLQSLINYCIALKEVLQDASALWAAAISTVVRGCISSSSLQSANTSSI